MSIVHIKAPMQTPLAAFGAAVTAPPVGDAPRVQLFTKDEFEAADGSVEAGTWEATPGRFARSIINAEFAQFLAGHATFTTAAGIAYEFRAGDAAYFPPNTQGVWTIHDTVRKTFVIWR
jgi:uncharacterized cupin superfamily protein